MELLKGEVLDIHNEYGSYGEYKAALDGELQKSAESFVRIGYLLKVAVDTDILKESGYRSMYEFAKDEYNLDKSQVSRFIRINDEFSENGYSDRLQEKYRNFGYAKLALMLLLPAEIKEELSAGYSKSEIQTIKDEIDEERKISDLEVMIEEKDQRQQSFGIFGKVIYQIGRDNPEMYLKLHDAVCDTPYDGTIRLIVDKLVDALAPSGEAIITVRIAGEGRKMLSIKGVDVMPVIVDIRSSEKSSCTWNQMIDEIETLCPDAADGRKAWKILYGKDFPEKTEEVAPVQPPKKAEPRKVSKITKAKTPEKTMAEPMQEKLEKETQAAGQQERGEKQEAEDIETDENRENKAQGEDSVDREPDQKSPADTESSHDEDGTGGRTGENSAGGSADCEDDTGVAPVQPENEQISGQMNITNFPQYMPDSMVDNQRKNTEEADMEKSDAVIIDSDGMRKHIKNQKKMITDELYRMRMHCDEENWDKLVKSSQEIITRAKSIKTMEEIYRNE